MALNDEMYKQYLRQKQLEEYNKKKKELNSQRQINGLSKIKSFYDNINSNGNKLSNFGQTMSQSQNGAVANLGNKLQSFGNRLQSFGQPSTTAVNNPITSSIGSEVGSNALSNSLLSATGGAGASEGTSAIGSAIGKAAPSATSLAGTSGAGLSSVAGAAGKAAPFLGAAISGAQAAQDASKGDYIGAGLNGIAAGASFVPGVGTAVAMGAQALDKVNKMFRAAKDKANAKAMQQSMEELQKSEQANDESLAGLQDTFQNDSEQAAQNMTQPNNYQDIINKISNNLNTASGTPVNSNLGINTLGDIQTPQNGLSYIPQNEDLDLGVPTGGAAPISNMFNKHIKPIQVMDDGNGGAVIDKTATNALASQYQEPKESLLEKIKNGLGQFKAGYDDNSQNGFANGDLVNQLAGNTNQPVTTDENGVLTGGAATTKKTIMNRLGEAAGTGRRLMANPWVQAGIAGLISKADGGDIGDMAQAAYKYGTAKAMSDQYYKMMNPDAKVMPVLNTYGAEDYKAKAYNDFNLGRSVITRRQLLKLQNPDKSDIEIDAMAKAQGIDPDEPISIKGYETVVKGKQKDRDLDIKADKNQWQKTQGQQKIGIQAKNANTNAGRLGETIRHNGVTEAQGAERNKIASEKAKNQGNKNNSNNGSAPEGTIITNPTTGKRQVKRNGKWVDIK